MRKSAKSTETRADAGSVVKIVIFLAAVVMAVILLAVGIYVLTLKKDEPPAPDSSAVKDRFSEIIAKGDDIFEDEIYELPEMTIEEAFPLYQVKDAYYQECEISYSDPYGGVTKRQKQVIRSGEKYNIKTYDGGSLIETIIFDGERALIVDETTGARKLFTPNADVSIFDLAALPDHGRILSLIKEHDDKKEGGNSPLTRYNYRVLSSKVLNILSLVLDYKEGGVSDRYYYYLDYGMIYHCETTVSTSLGKIPSYSMTTTSFSPTIAHLLTEDLFKIEEVTE